MGLANFILYCLDGVPTQDFELYERFLRLNCFSVEAVTREYVHVRLKYVSDCQWWQKD